MKQLFDLILRLIRALGAVAAFLRFITPKR